MNTEIHKGGLPPGEAKLLAVIAVVAALASALSFYVANKSAALPVTMTAEDEEDRPRIPLPAGPRKYQAP